MEKNEVIQKAYEDLGIPWESVNHIVDYGGWLDHNRAIIPEINENDFCIGVTAIRPKSLEGIENNNGWTKIEKWKRLPKESFFCQIILKTGRRTVGQYMHTIQKFCILRSGYIDIEKVTHYSILSKDSDPLY